MKKIMFNDRYGLTQAVLNGTKTMTRRLVPDSILNKVGEYQQYYYEGALDTINEQEAILMMITYERMLRTAYRVGEVVAVAQPYKDIATTHHFIETCLANEWSLDYRDAGWNNSLFVKPCLMPHQIRITDIKVERLQDISDEDCLKEGIIAGELKHSPKKEFVLQPLPYGCWVPYSFYGASEDYYNPREAFAALINRPGVGRKGLWAENPLVVAYSFELVK